MGLLPPKNATVPKILMLQKLCTSTWRQILVIVIQNFSCCILTHICLMDFPILINFTSPFSFKGCLVYFFHFYHMFDRISCSAASDQVLHCLPMSQKWDARLIWVNQVVSNGIRWNLRMSTKSLWIHNRTNENLSGFTVGQYIWAT